ncbi:hypothetical protein B0H16DRAFT_1541062 [Mycena metata]|uniref:Uncharacterized protein n=1 Tax=Mycena metata TaxID=1033252 RepID=A0AAD7NBQ8_9AGAR|nr:hypothetical protein B0H16DRAFT_1541062 [Mycena metata]
MREIHAPGLRDSWCVSSSHNIFFLSSPQLSPLRAPALEASSCIPSPQGGESVHEHIRISGPRCTLCPHSCCCVPRRHIIYRGIYGRIIRGADTLTAQEPAQAWATRLIHTSSVPATQRARRRRPSPLPPAFGATHPACPCTWARRAPTWAMPASSHTYAHTSNDRGDFEGTRTGAGVGAGTGTVFCPLGRGTNCVEVFT